MNRPNTFIPLNCPTVTPTLNHGVGATSSTLTSTGQRVHTVAGTNRVIGTDSAGMPISGTIVNGRVVTNPR